jgi:two-component system sensor histidine kinase CpxA
MAIRGLKRCVARVSDGFRFMIGSLTARIFAIFWLTLALVLMLVLMLPKLDSRQMTELLESEQRQGIMIEQHVEAELATDPPTT